MKEISFRLLNLLNPSGKSMAKISRSLQNEVVEGEIGLVIDYTPGEAIAADVLIGALELIKSLDGLDHALLSSIDTSLQPVSILNDVQHSSLKLLLARALKSVPDQEIENLEWKKWVGRLLVKGKYALLQKIDQPELIEVTLKELDYSGAPAGLLGYEPPNPNVVRKALENVGKARAILGNQAVTVQTELGDVSLVDRGERLNLEQISESLIRVVESSGVDTFIVKSPDLIGNAQWSLVKSGKSIRARILDLDWVDSYHRREFAILPGDALRSKYSERVSYDDQNAEIERHIEITEVIEVISPPENQRLVD